MANNITMSYGDYNFSPVPLIDINKTIIKTGGQLTLGSTFTITLDGTLSETNSDSGLGSLLTKKEELRTAFNQDGKYFVIKCNDNFLLECYPRVVGDIQFGQSNNNWVFTIPFTLTLEFDNTPADENIAGSGEDGAYQPPFLQDFSENWNIEFVAENQPYEISSNDKNPYAVRLTHNVSAVGKSHYSGPGLTGSLDKMAWKQAEEYVQTKLGFDEEIFLSENALNLESGIWTAYDHFRTNAVDEAAGSYSVTESWLVLGDREGQERKALEDFTMSVESAIDQPYTTVNIQGTIQGLAENNYNNTDFELSGSKYENAISYWNDISGAILAGRAEHALSGAYYNTEATRQLIGYSPSQGTVTYNVAYDSRPANCIANAKFENIEISDQNPADVFSIIPIIGRANGPILQYFNTITELKRSVNVEVLVDPGTCATKFDSPHADVQTVITEVRNSITGYNNIRVESDTENWNFKTGRYTRSVTWVAANC